MNSALNSFLFSFCLNLILSESLKAAESKLQRWGNRQARARNKTENEPNLFQSGKRTEYCEILVTQASFNKRKTIFFTHIRFDSDLSIYCFSFFRVRLLFSRVFRFYTSSWSTVPSHRSRWRRSSFLSLSHSSVLIKQKMKNKNKSLTLHNRVSHIHHLNGTRMNIFAKRTLIVYH